MAVYMSAFILCVEWLSTKYRVLASTIVAGVYPIGEVSLGIAAICLPHYRTFLLVFYTPAIFVLSYLWLLPESARWLLAAGHNDRAAAILAHTARQNNRVLSPASLDILKSEATKSPKIADDGVSFTTVVRHKALVLRLLACSCEWIIVTLVYYGISVNATKVFNDDNKVRRLAVDFSVTISSVSFTRFLQFYHSPNRFREFFNRFSLFQYLTYITTVVGEIPAAMLTYFLLKTVGRRTAVSVMSTVTATSLLVSTFVPTHHTILIRVCFSIGMMAASSTLAIVYVFTAEIWPTAQRNTLMNICSMIGRIGSMVAPLAILLVS